MTRSLVDEVKEKLDVIDVISGYIKLHPAGSNFRGLCPFHREKTPSFMVSKEKQIFHCFGCGKGGDLITFVQEIEGMDFKEALQMLAERAGIDWKKWQTGYSGNPQEADKKEIIRRIMEASTAFYQKCLSTPEGNRTQEYLSQRGLNKKLIDDFRLGYAPRNGTNNFPNALFNHLKGMGFENSHILDSGNAILYSKDGRNSYIDRFRGRVVFPISDSLGRVVGFSARLLPGDISNQGKYINTPQTVLYDKSGLLYGFHLAKKAIRDSKEVILLEGNLDVVLSHQAGISQAVATCGTALNKKQLIFLRRYTQKLTLAFDADMAGVKATKRAAELAWEEDFDVKAIPLKIGKDVADIVLENPKKWQGLVQKKKSITNFFFQLSFKNRSLNLDQKNAISEKLLTLLSKVPSEVEKSHYIHRLSEEIGVPEALVWEKFNSLKNKNSINRSITDNNSSGKIKINSRKEMLERRIIGIVYNFPKIYYKFRENINHEFGKLDSFWEPIKSLLDSIPEEERTKFTIKDWKFPSRNIELQISEIGLTIEKELEDNGDLDNHENIEKEFVFCLSSLSEEDFKEKKSEIIKEIKMAQQKGDVAVLNNLMKEMKEISSSFQISKNAK